MSRCAKSVLKIKLFIAMILLRMERIKCIYGQSKMPSIIGMLEFRKVNVGRDMLKPINIYLVCISIILTIWQDPPIYCCHTKAMVSQNVMTDYMGIFLFSDTPSYAMTHDYAQWCASNHAIICTHSNIPLSHMILLPWSTNSDIIILCV